MKQAISAYLKQFQKQLIAYSVSIVLILSFSYQCFNSFSFNVWVQQLGVPALLYQHFGDNYAVLVGFDRIRAVDSQNLAEISRLSEIDVHYWGIFYPLARTFHSISAENYVQIGILILFIFLFSLFFIFKLLDRGYIYFLLCLFSPALLFCYERLNWDLLMFALLTFGVVFILSNSHSIFKWLGTFLILFASFLKLIPFFSIGFLVNSQKKYLLLFTVLVIGFLGYLFIIWQDYLLINKVLQWSTGAAYGKFVLAKFLADSKGLSLEILKYISGLLFGVIIVITAFLAYKKSIVQSSLQFKKNDQRLAFFLAGSGLYIGTFWIGNNYDYKLVFLLFTIPYLLQDIHQGKRNYLVLGLILFILWSNLFTFHFNMKLNALPYGAAIYIPNTVIIWYEELAAWLLLILFSYRYFLLIFLRLKEFRINFSTKNLF